jgi:hypothetical protein
MWIVGVASFSRGLMADGIQGEPRRTQITEAVYNADHPGWELATS